MAGFFEKRRARILEGKLRKIDRIPRYLEHEIHPSLKDIAYFGRGINIRRWSENVSMYNPNSTNDSSNRDKFNILEHAKEFREKKAAERIEPKNQSLRDIVLNPIKAWRKLQAKRKEIRNLEILLGQAPLPGQSSENFHATSLDTSKVKGIGLF